MLCLDQLVVDVSHARTQITLTLIERGEVGPLMMRGMIRLSHGPVGGDALGGLGAIADHRGDAVCGALVPRGGPVLTTVGSQPGLECGITRCLDENGQPDAHARCPALEKRRA